MRMWCILAAILAVTMAKPQKKQEEGCEAVNCGEGHHCEMMTAMCTDCEPFPTCVPEREEQVSCENVNCPDGSRCRIMPVPCIAEPCPPAPRCVPTVGPGGICPLCAMYCPFGMAEAQGDECPPCKCKKCDIPPCRNGFKPGRCECNENNLEPNHGVCPPVRCRNYCPFGRVPDANGCGTCPCLPPPRIENKKREVKCSAKMCKNLCPNGRVQDNAGCETCTCLPTIEHHKRQSPPAPVACPMCWCPFGLALDASPDEDGCNCNCASCDRECVHGYLPGRCECAVPKKECRMWCPNGFAVDEDGNPMCKCAPEEKKKRQQAVCDSLPPGSCDLDCEHGLATDENGCERCECRRCSPIMCAMYCEHGFKLDENGCDKCECRPRPCSPIRCEMHCENGFEIDQNGCEVCRCRGRGRGPSPPIACMMWCPNGMVLDKAGNPTCECVPDAEEEEGDDQKRQEAAECSPIRCKKACQFGFEKNANGCEICKCKRPPIQCMMHCEHGFRLDQDGNPTCECVPDAEEEEGDDKKRQEATGCSQKKCRMACQFGFETDANGCEICKCKMPIQCMMHCEHGFQLDRDGNPTCECAPGVQQKREAATCSPIMCMMYCKNGFEKDANGCDICKCKKPAAKKSTGQSRKQLLKRLLQDVLDLNK